MAVERSNPASGAGAGASPTPDAEIAPPDWKGIAWGVARLLGVGIAAALAGLLIAEVTLRLMGVSPRRPGPESAFDLDGETAGVFQAGAHITGRWKPGANFQASFNS